MRFRRRKNEPVLDAGRLIHEYAEQQLAQERQNFGADLGREWDSEHQSDTVPESLASVGRTIADQGAALGLKFPLSANADEMYADIAAAQYTRHHRR